MKDSTASALAMAPGWYWLNFAGWIGVVQVAFWGHAGGDKLGFFDPTEMKLHFHEVTSKMVTEWGPRVPDWTPTAERSDEPVNTRMKTTDVSDADPDPLTFLAWVETVEPGYKPTHHHGTSYVGMALTLEDLAQRLNRPAAELLAEACEHVPAPSPS